MQKLFTVQIAQRFGSRTIRTPDDSYRVQKTARTHPYNDVDVSSIKLFFFSGAGEFHGVRRESEDIEWAYPDVSQNTT